MASPRLALVWMMARRLTLRAGRAPRGVVLWMWGALLLTGLGAAGVLGGSEHLAPVALVGVGSMAALIGVALRFFPAAMAVSVTGIALSCASLMTVLGVTSGFEAEVVRSVAKFNGHILLTEYGLDFDEYEVVSNRLERDPRIIAASPFAYSMIAVVRVVDPESEESSDGPLVVIGKGVDPRRAGNLEGFAELSILEAVSACTLRPARLIGVEGERGSLRVGARADLVVLLTEDIPGDYAGMAVKYGNFINKSNLARTVGRGPDPPPASRPEGAKARTFATVIFENSGRSSARTSRGPISRSPQGDMPATRKARPVSPYCPTMEITSSTT